MSYKSVSVFSLVSPPVAQQNYKVLKLWTVLRSKDGVRSEPRHLDQPLRPLEARRPTSSSANAGFPCPSIELSVQVRIRDLGGPIETLGY